MQVSHRRRVAALSVAIVSAALAVKTDAAILYNPVVVDVGDGNITASGTGYTTTLIEYANSTLNSQVSNSAYNSSVSGTRLVTSASATSEGILSNNGALADNAAKGLASTSGYVFNGGYNAANGTASVNGTAANADRSFGYAPVTMTAGLGGATVGITKTQATTFANNNIRGVTGDNAATVFWGAGAGSGSTPGFRYVDASNNNQLSSTVTNGRGVELLNGQLFGTTGAGTNHGLYAIGTGQPTTTGQTATSLITSTTSSPYEFVLIDDPTNAVSTTGSFGFDTAYIADDSVPASGGGIQKYTWSGSAWVAAYTMNGGLTTGARGLAGQLDLDTNQVVLWTTSTDNVSLYQITDTGVNSAFMKIADAPTNTVFRGVALAPAPEPGSIALLAGAATLTGLRRRRRN